MPAGATVGVALPAKGADPLLVSVLRTHGLHERRFHPTPQLPLPTELICACRLHCMTVPELYLHETPWPETPCGADERAIVAFQSVSNEFRALRLARQTCADFPQAVAAADAALARLCLSGVERGDAQVVEPAPRPTKRPRAEAALLRDAARQDPPTLRDTEALRDTELQEASHEHISCEQISFVEMCVGLGCTSVGLRGAFAPTLASQPNGERGLIWMPPPAALDVPTSGASTSGPELPTSGPELPTPGGTAAGSQLPSSPLPTSRTLARGAVALRVPASSLLSASAARAAPELAPLLPHIEAEGEWTEHILVMLLLLLEVHKGNASKWAQWIQLLPPAEHMAPLSSWEESQLLCRWKGV
mgnify:CR=1 FL=1